MEIPLVSIIIIAFNSSKYILETLESAKNQTYSNVELIVSDDCSTDDTCKIVEDFFANNVIFFKSSILVKAKKNTGISGNCNRGVLASKGKYIKIIAGDDLLTANCICDYVNYFQSSHFIKIAASKTKIFYENDINNYQIWPKDREFPHGLAKQRLEILKANFVYNVSIFFSRDLYDSVNGFDERYPMIEDYPFNYKVINSGNAFYFLDKVTVNYRVNFDSTTRPFNQNKFVNEVSQSNASSFIKTYILSDLKSHNMYLWWLLRWGKITIINLIIKNGNNINSTSNILNKKILFLVKYISGKLRKFENSF